jgi:hypothetical protein
MALNGMRMDMARNGRGMAIIIRESKRVTVREKRYG